MTRDFLSRCTVLIPAYNEGNSLLKTLADLKAYAPELNIIVVDDGSVDSTAENLSKQSVATVIRHRKNRGYGAALKSGVLKAETEYVLTYDSDGQHRPEDAVRLFEFSLNADLDLGVGARTADSHQVPIRMPGKWVLKKVANFLAKTDIPDLNSGMRVFRRKSILKYLHIMPEGFSFSTTSTLAMFTQGYAVDYMPITVLKREGSKSTVRLQDGLDTLMLIIRIMVIFQPLRFFIPISLFFIFIGGIKAIAYDWVYNVGAVTTSSLIIFSTGIMIFCLGVISDQISSLRMHLFSHDENKVEILP